MRQVDDLTRRYGGSTLDSFVAVLCPTLIPIKALDKTIKKLPGQSHFRASFTVGITEENRGILQRGRTGKFVPGDFALGGDTPWREIAKGRIIDVDPVQGIAAGEVYVGATAKYRLSDALKSLAETDFLEIDQYGAAAKLLSGLAEYELAGLAKAAGYTVRRMPEDMAKHLGAYPNFDFELEKGGVVKKVEVKSLWGTDTDRARLIHSRSGNKPPGDEATWTDDQRRKYYPTSSCKFETQDIFAVSLFLRTGNIQDFAFARSVPKKDEETPGLPRSTNHPEHVHQNPVCQPGDGTWFHTIDEVWKLP